MGRASPQRCSRPDCTNVEVTHPVCLRLYERRKQTDYKYRLCGDCLVMLKTILRENCQPSQVNMQRWTQYVFG